MTRSARLRMTTDPTKAVAGWLVPGTVLRQEQLSERFEVSKKGRRRLRRSA